MGRSTDKMDYRENPQHRKEVPAEKGSSIIALHVDVSNGTPSFVVERVETVVAISPDAAKDWTERQIGDGAQIVFVRGPEGWFLKATNSNFHFSQAQIESFFSPKLLEDLWLSNYVATRERYFETLRETGIH